MDKISIHVEMRILSAPKKQFYCTKDLEAQSRLPAVDLRLVDAHNHPYISDYSLYQPSLWITNFESSMNSKATCVSTQGPKEEGSNQHVVYIDMVSVEVIIA